MMRKWELTYQPKKGLGFADRLAIVILVIYGIMMSASLILRRWMEHPIQIDQQLQAPSMQGHIFGTDGLGRDVLMLLFEASANTLTIAIGAMFIAACIGVLVGFWAGYFRNDRFQLNRRQLLLAGLSILPNILLLYWFLNLWKVGNVLFFFVLAFMLLINSGIYFFFYQVPQNAYWKHILALPMDDWLSRFMDFYRSIPGLFLLLMAAFFFHQLGVVQMALLIGGLAWLSFGRHMRAETWRVSARAHVLRARMQGRSMLHILIYDLLPYVWRPLIMIALFGMAAAVSLEATFAYIGIGNSANYISWGDLILEARNNLQAWWLWAFPGLIISILLWSLLKISSNMYKSTSYRSMQLEEKNP